MKSSPSLSVKGRNLQLRTCETPELRLLGTVVFFTEPEGENGEFPLRIHDDVIIG